MGSRVVNPYDFFHDYFIRAARGAHQLFELAQLLVRHCQELVLVELREQADGILRHVGHQLFLLRVETVDVPDRQQKSLGFQPTTAVDNGVLHRTGLGIDDEAVKLAEFLVSPSVDRQMVELNVSVVQFASVDETEPGTVLHRGHMSSRIATLYASSAPPPPPVRELALPTPRAVAS